MMGTTTGIEDQAIVGAVSGKFVTETFEYDGGRQVTVYVPPNPPEAVVFAGDGQFISQWGEVLETADVPSTMIVGVHGLADETPRLHEYSPAFAPDRFAAHARFFVEDVRRWTRSRFGVALPAGRTAVCGVSAGGELALAIGLRHPDICCSRRGREVLVAVSTATPARSRCPRKNCAGCRGC
jgi:pimeloyl-ACP methyl ester carboxylesterase